MVTAAIGKTIFNATVRRSLHMNCLYCGILQVCVILSIQSRYCASLTTLKKLAYSLDLNPIESFWDALGCATCSRLPPLATLRGLETALQEK